MGSPAAEHFRIRIEASHQERLAAAHGIGECREKTHGYKGCFHQDARFLGASMHAMYEMNQLRLICCLNWSRRRCDEKALL